MRIKVKKFYIPLIACLTTPIFTSCANSENINYSLMKETYINDVVSTYAVTEYESMPKDKIMDQLEKKTLSGEDTYYWKDVIYKDDGDVTHWSVSPHVDRMLTFCVIAKRKNDTFYEDIAIKCTNYWLYNNYKSSNWWINDLFGNSKLATTGLFIYDKLTDKAKAAFISKVHRATIYYNPAVKLHKGGNLFNYVDLSIKSAIVTKDKLELDATVKRLEEEIEYSDFEGFKKDGSFFQHGQQVQTCSSYGTTVATVGKLLSILAKGNITFSEEKLKIISNYALRGTASFIHKGYINPLGTGREYSRPDSLRTDLSWKGLTNLKYYLDCNNLPYREAWNNYFDKLDNKKQMIDDNQLLFFEDGNYAVTALDGIYFCYRGAKKGMNSSECVNDENQLGLNLSYGSNTAIIEKGNEYNDLSPLARYDYMPGTTSYQVDQGDDEKGDEDKRYELAGDSQLIKIKNDVYNDGTLTGKLGEGWYVNYLSDDQEIAVFAQDGSHHTENKFTVTGIVSKDGIINIGSNISYSGTITEGEQSSGAVFSKGSRTLHTTLEQCYFKDYEKSSDNEVTLGGVQYKTLDSKEIIVTERDFIETHNRSWRRNNPSDSYKDYNNHVKGKTITLAVNHEDRENASYAYIARPKSQRDRQINLITDINDNKKIHAVELSNRKIVAVFYEEGSFIDSQGISHFGKAHEIKIFTVGEQS